MQILPPEAAQVEAVRLVGVDSLSCLDGPDSLVLYLLSFFCVLIFLVIQLRLVHLVHEEEFERKSRTNAHGHGSNEEESECEAAYSSDGLDVGKGRQDMDFPLDRRDSEGDLKPAWVKWLCRVNRTVIEERLISDALNAVEISPILCPKRQKPWVQVIQVCHF